MDTCKICGSIIDTRGFAPASKEFLSNEGLCYHCYFWAMTYEEDLKREPHTTAVINGNHYCLEPHTAYERGCAGRMHKIKFFDGTIVECDNLWHQGEISKEWLEKFPDNAEFIDC